MRDRHLAGTEAVETDLVLEVDQLGARLGIEIGCRNADLEFVLQSLVEGLGDLHGINLLPLLPRPERPWQCSICSTLEPCGLTSVGSANPRPPRGPRFSKNSSCKRCKRLVRAEGLEPPQLSSLEPKSSASTSSATPARKASSPAAMPRAAGLITCAHRFAAKKWPRESPPCDRSRLDRYA